MKIVRLLSVILILITVITNGYAEERIRLASGEWYPYQSENLKYGGVVSRIVEEAYSSEGVTAEYGYFPWKRSYSYAENGEWDGTFLWFDTPERRDRFYISDPVIDIQYVFFHLKSYTFDWKTIEDLKSVNIGSTLGYDLGEAFQKAEQSGTIKVDRVPEDEQNFKRLLASRIQIFPCDLEVGYAIIQKIFPHDQAKLFTHHPIPLKAAPHHLLLSKKIERNKHLIELFNKGLKQLKASGKYEQYITESRRGEYKK